MSTRQRARAERRKAARARGNRTPSPMRGGADAGQGYEAMELTPTGEALLAGIVDKAKRGVPIEQLGDTERVLLAIVAASLGMGGVAS